MVGGPGKPTDTGSEMRTAEVPTSFTATTLKRYTPGSTLTVQNVAAVVHEAVPGEDVTA